MKVTAPYSILTLQLSRSQSALTYQHKIESVDALLLCVLHMQLLLNAYEFVPCADCAWVLAVLVGSLLHGIHAWCGLSPFGYCMSDA